MTKTTRVDGHLEFDEIFKEVLFEISKGGKKK